MFSAKEARDNYDKYGILANSFIEKYIEPKIISASLSSTEITTDAEAKWQQGYTFKFPAEFKNGNRFDDIVLTNTILAVLKRYGYDVDFADVDWSSFNEYHTIEDIMATISWKEVL